MPDNSPENRLSDLWLGSCERILNSVQETVRLLALVARALRRANFFARGFAKTHCRIQSTENSSRAMKLRQPFPSNTVARVGPTHGPTHRRTPITFRMTPQL